jgi:SPP1 gp7 family putative phage head morphogenesis protein
MQTITRESLLALDNAAIITQAHAAGLKVYPEDLLVNYAEIDHELAAREDEMVQKTSERIRAAAESWLLLISSKEDVTPDSLPLDEILHEEILDHIHSVWSFGSGEADKELDRMLKAQNGELDFLSIFADKSGGVPATDDDLWSEAYEWYDTYAQQLGASAKDDLFIKMQPLILEAIDKGIVRTQLVNMLLDQFARVGEVRADIIARTESNKAYNWGRRYKFDSSEALAGYRYSAIMDRRTTEICSALHGSSWEKGDPNLDNYTPPNHFRCRSILVPIHKYKDWTFKDPDLSELTDKEQGMLQKFSDSSFYPKRGR